MGMNYVEQLTASFVDELQNIGMAKQAAPTDLSKAKGIKRVGELLSGSRKGKLFDNLQHKADRYNKILGHPKNEPFDKRLGAAGRAAKGIAPAGERFNEESRAVRKARIATGAGATALGAGVTAHQLNKESALLPDKLKRLQERRDPDGIETKESAARPK